MNLTYSVRVHPNKGDNQCKEVAAQIRKSLRKLSMRVLAANIRGDSSQ